MGIQGVQGYTGVYKGIQGVYKGIQGYTTGIQGVYKWYRRGMQRFIGYSQDIISSLT